MCQRESAQRERGDNRFEVGEARGAMHLAVPLVTHLGCSKKDVNTAIKLTPVSVRPAKPLTVDYFNALNRTRCGLAASSPRR